MKDEAAKDKADLLQRY